MRFLYEIVEEKIQEAVARGDFQDLPTKGKPYIFDGYLFEPEDQRIQRKILRDHHFQPLPLELRKKIEKQLEGIELTLKNFQEGYARRLKALVESGGIVLSFPPLEYWKYPRQHKRFVQEYLPIWINAKQDSQFRQAVKQLKALRNSAVVRLKEEIQRLMQLIEEYDEEVTRLCLQERDFFRLETGFAFKQLDWWEKVLAQLFPAIKEE